MKTFYYLIFLPCLLSASCSSPNQERCDNSRLCHKLKHQQRIFKATHRLEKDNIILVGSPSAMSYYKNFPLPPLLISDHLRLTCKDQLLISLYIYNRLYDGSENNIYYKNDSLEMIDFPRELKVTDSFVMNKSRIISDLIYELLSNNKDELLLKVNIRLLSDKRLHPYNEILINKLRQEKYFDLLPIVPIEKRARKKGEIKKIEELIPVDE